MKKTVSWFKSVLKSFLENKCSMHAAGLTYFAMLAMVPILCVLLTVAKACGADDLAKRQINAQVDAWIENVEKGQDNEIATVLTQSEEQRERKKAAAAALAKQAREIRDAIFARIDKFDAGKVGLIGLVMLLWTVISSIGMVETSFNEIWNVPKPRPLWKRALLYLFIASVMPVFAALAMSLPVLNMAKDILIATLGATWLTQWVSNGIIWFLDSLLFRFAVTFAIASLNFGFFFWIIPNCKVRFRPALCGGAITAVLFGCWMKLCAVAQIGIAKSSAMYGSFAFVPIVLAWLYMSWQIVLLGSCMTRAFEAVGGSEGER